MVVFKAEVSKESLNKLENESKQITYLSHFVPLIEKVCKTNARQRTTIIAVPLTGEERNTTPQIHPDTNP